jgi:hypothetical protein
MDYYERRSRFSKRSNKDLILCGYHELMRDKGMTIQFIEKKCRVKPNLIQLVIR